MSAHGDKTLHRKICNINDTDTPPPPPPYPLFKNVIFAHEYVHEFMFDLECEFVKDFFTKFVQSNNHILW